MFAKIPVRYFLYANLPICIVGLLLQVWKPPLRYAMPFAVFEIAFGAVVISRGLLEWKAVRGAKGGGDGVRR